MEFLDGMTLKHRIGGKPMEIETVLDLGIDNILIEGPFDLRDFNTLATIPSS